MSIVGTCNNCIQLANETFYTSGSTSPLYLDIVNQDNLDISNCVTVTTEVIKTYPEMIEYDECGCPIDECEKASLRINIHKNDSPTIVDCGYSGFTLDVNGLVLFSLYSGITTNFMSSQCCLALGFTPEIQNGIFVCRWQEIYEETCDDYTPVSIDENGYQVFIGPSGNTTNITIYSECCPTGTIPELFVNNQWKCKEDVPPIEIVSCSGYTISSINSDGIIVFELVGGGLTSQINSECCVALGYSPQTVNGQTVCKATCETYASLTVGNDGYITFVRPNGSTYVEVPLIECCPINTIATPTLTTGGYTVYKCAAQTPTPTGCRYITTLEFAGFFICDSPEDPGCDELLTVDDVNNLYFEGYKCDGTVINHNTSLYPGQHQTIIVNACVDMDTLVYSDLPFLTINFDDNVDCSSTGPTGAKMLALRSHSPGFSTPNNMCGQGLVTSCYVYTQSGGMVISNGDVVYNYGDTPFNGDNKYYKIQTQISGFGDPFYICKVDVNGNIIVHSICPNDI